MSSEFGQNQTSLHLQSEIKGGGDHWLVYFVAADPGRDSLVWFPIRQSLWLFGQDSLVHIMP